MATNYSTRPPPKEIPFTELLPSGEQFVTNPWYTWALNIRQAVDTLRLIVGDPDGDGVVTDVERLLTDDVSVFAPRMTPTVTGGCGALTTIEFAPTQPNLYALPFETGVDTSADFGTMLPFYWAGKTFKVWIYWGHGDSGTDWDVKWEVVANTTFDNESIILDFVPGITVTDTGGTSGNLYIARSAAVPITSYENEEGSLVSMRITRRGADAEDTMDITAYLLAVRFVLEGEPVFEPDVLGNDPYWADVVLLLHGDGTDGSTTIIDSSSFAQTVTITGTSAISTAESKFGGSSLKGAASSYYEVVLGSDGVFAGDFTIEMWVQQGANNVVFTSGTGIYLYNALFFYTGANSPSMAAGNTSTSSTWAHFAISRTAGVLKTFKEGLEQASISYSTTMDFSTMRFGYFQPNGNLYYQHYLDDIRVTKNVGRYTTDFAPPTAAFPDY